METIFTLNDDKNISTKINMDDLYEKQKERNLYTLSIYNKILNRIHYKIKVTSRQYNNNKFVWYVIPEVILGIPKYDVSECTSYLINELNNNGFRVKYIYPNLLIISWEHWVPSYVRNEIKKKTGINLDNKGMIYNDKTDEPIEVFKNNNIKKQLKSYKDIETYKPLGIYNKDLLKDLNI